MAYRQREAIRLSMDLFGKYDFPTGTQSVTSNDLNSWYAGLQARIDGFQDDGLYRAIQNVPGRYLFHFICFRKDEYQSDKNIPVTYNSRHKA